MSLLDFYCWSTQVRNTGLVNVASLESPPHVVWWTGPRKEASPTLSLQAQTNQVIKIGPAGSLSEGHHGSSREKIGLSLRIYGACGACVVEIDRLVRFKHVDQVPFRCG